MPPALVVTFRVCCVAVGLVFANTAKAAEPKQHPLIGATRAQIVVRLGEPTSQIVTGNREVLFFDRERFELVDGVVTFAERIAVDPSPAAPVPPPASGPASSPATAGSRTAVPSRPEGTVPVAERAQPAEVVPTKSAAPAQPVVREPEERVQIKAVRPRS